MNLISKGAYKLLDGVSLLGGLVMGSQMPGMALEYEQTAKSMLYEAEKNLEGWQKIADSNNIASLKDLLEQYQISETGIDSSTAIKLSDDLTRASDLSDIVEQVANTPAIQKPLAVLQDIASSETGREILGLAKDNYEAVIPLNLENAVYGLGTAITAYLGVQIIKTLHKKKKYKNN